MGSGRDARGSHVAVDGEGFAPSARGADGLIYAVYVYAVGADRPGPCARIHSKMERTRPRSPLRPAMERTVVATWALGGRKARRARRVGIGFDELVEDVVDEAPVGAAAEVLERLVELARAQAAELAGTNVGEEGGGVARESLAGDGAGAEGDVRAATGGADGRAEITSRPRRPPRGAGSEGGARQATSADRRRSRRQRAGVAASRAPRAPVDAAPVPLPRTRARSSPAREPPATQQDRTTARPARPTPTTRTTSRTSPRQTTRMRDLSPVPLDRASRPRRLGGRARQCALI